MKRLRRVEESKIGMQKNKRKEIKTRLAKHKILQPNGKFYEPTLSAGILSSEMIKGVSLGDMANILSVGMPDNKIFSGYKEVLNTQNTILKSSEVIIPGIGEGSIVAAGKMDSILSPITGTIVELGLNAASANKLFEDGVIGKSCFSNLQKISDISFDIIKNQQSVILSELEQSSVLGNLIQNDRLASFRMTATGLDVMTRATPSFPLDLKLPSLEISRDTLFFNEPQIREEQTKLDDILSEIDSGLVESRRGCWETFNAKRRDYIRQSSCSMRGLVDDLLRNLAPGKFPTRKDKIYYIVGLEAKKAEHLKRATRALLETYDNLSAWDHKPMKNDEFVRGVFITIEGCLISLLSERRKD